MESWMIHAACRGLPVSIWFPDRGEQTAAKQICAGCPCLSACRTFALSDDAPVHGIIAGWSSKERAQLRKQPRRESGAVAPGPPPRRRRGSGPVMLGPFPKISAAAVTTGWTRQALLEARATPG